MPLPLERVAPPHLLVFQHAGHVPLPGTAGLKSDCESLADLQRMDQIMLEKIHHRQITTLRRPFWVRIQILNCVILFGFC